MNFERSNHIPLPLISNSSIRIQSLEKHVHKWIIFSIKFIELWQNKQHDKRKIKLKRIFFSNQCKNQELPRIVDLIFEVKNNNNSHLISSNDQRIIMNFSDDYTTIRIILCSQQYFSL